MSSTNGAEQYSVGYSGTIIEQLAGWGELARRTDRGAEYLDAVREMRERLERDPRAWGDPMRDVPAMRVTLFRRYGQVLMVFYAVHAERRVVIVPRVVLTPGSPLANDAADPPPGL